MSPSAWRTKKNLKTAVMKELHTQICCTVTRTWIDISIIPSQMEVAPLHCTVDITQKRRLLKNTKETEKM